MQGRRRENNKKCSCNQASLKKVEGKYKTTSSKENCGGQRTKQLQEKKSHQTKTYNLLKIEIFFTIQRLLFGDYICIIISYPRLPALSACTLPKKSSLSFLNSADCKSGVSPPF